MPYASPRAVMLLLDLLDASIGTEVEPLGLRPSVARGGTMAGCSTPVASPSWLDAAMEDPRFAALAEARAMVEPPGEDHDEDEDEFEDEDEDEDEDA